MFKQLNYSVIGGRHIVRCIHKVQDSGINVLRRGECVRRRTRHDLSHDLDGLEGGAEDAEEVLTLGAKGGKVFILTAQLQLEVFDRPHGRGREALEVERLSGVVLVKLGRRLEDVGKLPLHAGRRLLVVASHVGQAREFCRLRLE